MFASLVTRSFCPVMRSASRSSIFNQSSIYLKSIIDSSAQQSRSWHSRGPARGIWPPIQAAEGLTDLRYDGEESKSSYRFEPHEFNGEDLLRFWKEYLVDHDESDFLRSVEDYVRQPAKDAREDQMNSLTIDLFKRLTEQQLRKLTPLDEEIDLPETVAKWKTKRGTKIFLVGTGHGTTVPGADVVATIRAVEPDVVVIPLCEARKHLLDRHVEFHPAAHETKILQDGRKAELVLGDRSGVATLRRTADFILGELINPIKRADETRVFTRTIFRERNVWFAISLAEAEVKANRDNQERPGVVVGIVDVSRLPGVVEEWAKMEESNMSQEAKYAIKKDLERTFILSAFFARIIFGGFSLVAVAFTVAFIVALLSLYPCLISGDCNVRIHALLHKPS